MENLVTANDSIGISLINLLISDLYNQNWDYYYIKNKIFFVAPKHQNKEHIKARMNINRQLILSKHKNFINDNLDILKNNLTSGPEAFQSPIKPIVEICKTKEQLSLFKMCRYYWSSPYSDYVGRRIKLIIRDSGLPTNPIIGIAALGSPIMQISSRDNYIGWTNSQKRLKLNSTMDIYILGAMPPYNDLLGGKLIAYILTSNEIRKIFTEKYSQEQLACMFTTSLYGRSSLYNRINYENKKLYNSVGYTKGIGTSHISSETFELMVHLLKDMNLLPSSNLLTGGSNWKIRVIRQCCRVLNIDEDSLLKHNISKEVFVIPLANNYSDYLCEKEHDLNYYDFPLEEMITYWKRRWLFPRRETIVSDKEKYRFFWYFTPDNFAIN
ncbi:TPA: Druantia anti-phage system protein DruA [Enterococcus faecium]